MPLKIMSWNIENFDNTKYTANTDKINNYFLKNIIPGIYNAGNNYPSLIVIQEATSQYYNISINSLNGNTSTDGLGSNEGDLQELIDNLRNRLNHAMQIIPGNPGWYVVPPLCLATNNGGHRIAVLFNSNFLTFNGPNVLVDNGNTIDSIDPIALLPTSLLGHYSTGFSQSLPNAPSQLNQINQNQLSGKVVDFSGGFFIQNARRPFLTSFSENNAPHRNINIYACHAPSPANQQNNAFYDNEIVRLGSSFLATFSNNVQMPPIPGPNDVDIVLGDFNCSPRDPQYDINGAIVANNDAFSDLKAKGFNVLFNDIGPAPTRPTLLRFNPGYQNNSSVLSYLENKAPDNLCIRYGANLTAVQHNALILDRIQGVLGYPSVLADASQLNRISQSLTTVKKDKGQRAYLKFMDGPGGYQRVRGLSDHLALIADV